MGKGSGPKPPDPQETAAAQTSANIGTAIANQYLRPNQNTPFGSQTTTQTGSTSWTDPYTGKTFDIPQFTSNTTLPADQQKLLNWQTLGQQNLAEAGSQQAGRLGSVLGMPVQAPNLTEAGRGPNLATTFRGTKSPITTSYGADDFSEDRRRVEEALMSRMNPSLDRERERLSAQLANQGIGLGTEAYDRAMGNFGQRANDAQMQAILAGGEEQSRLTGLERDQAVFQNQAQQQNFGQLLSRANFANSGKQQMFGNDLSRLGFNNDARGQEFGMRQGARSGAINDVNGLLSGSPVQMPQFSGGGGSQMPNTDVAGLINNQYQGQLQNYQNQQANNPMNGIMGGLFGLGNSAILSAGLGEAGGILSALPFLSDERTKQDIEPIGEMDVATDHGPEPLPVYEYAYKHDPGTRHIGVMAQEVKKVRPDAIVPMGKFLGVDYAKLGA